MKKQFLLLLVACTIGLFANAQIVAIPDANFKAALLGNAAINTNADGEIQVSEAVAYADSIKVQNLGIADLTGIEAFVSVPVILCSQNQLTSLTLNFNTQLAHLDCSNNHLISLEVTSNTALQSLNCNNNQLTNLDVSASDSLRVLFCAANLIDSIDVTSNNFLQVFRCNANHLTSLDVSNNTALLELNCSNNNLSNLDVSTNLLLNYLACSNNSISALSVANNPLLYYLNCGANQLSTIDVTNNPGITDLRCNNNQISSLDVSAQLVLAGLHCNANQLNSLDLSFNSALVYLDCPNNQLTSLNVKNGNNANVFHFATKNNPALTCIQVDDSLYSSANWGSGIDASMSFGNSCLYCLVAIPDANFKAALVTNPAINTNGNTEIECSEAAAFTGSLDVSNRAISNLTGISAFTAISALNCSNNNLTSLNISANTQLASLRCSNNQLNALSVSANTSLVELYCRNNNLTVLDVSNNAALSTLYCGNNQITHLNLSMLSAFEYLDALNNQLIYLNIQNGNNTNIQDFDATGNPNLLCIQVDDTSYMQANWFAYIDPIASFSLTCSCTFPAAAGLIVGATSVSACANQLGIIYSIDTLANALSYSWNLPPLASIVGTTDSNIIQLNFSAYSWSDTIKVSGKNLCGNGPSASLAINFKPIPLAEICRTTIDSASQKTILEWQKPIESYVNGYVIFRENAGAFVNIDTVSNASYSAYLDTGSHPALQAEKYKIAVLDSCGNVGDISLPFEHQTIRLYGSIQPGGIAKLYWTDYIGINDSNRYFNLLRDTIGSGPFKDTLASNISPMALMSKTDLTSAAYPLCRYVVEMVYTSNCNPSQRVQVNRSTSRSNIKNKVALFDSSGVGMEDFEKHFQGIQVYPNPAHDLLAIQMNSKDLINEIVLYDLLGKTVRNETHLNTPKSTVLINLLGIEKGIYFLNIQSGIYFYKTKLIID